MIQASRRHLEEVRESYLQHQRVAFRYGLQCAKAALMAFTHGLVPGLYRTGASDLVRRLAAGRAKQE